MSQEIEFKIDAWTPETIPQERLGEYLIQLAKLYGETSSVRFKRLRKGSAVLVSEIAAPARPKVERRLLQIRSGQATKDVVDAYNRIDDMLAEDNATGIIRGLEDRRVIPFPGRERPKPVEYGPVREDGFIEGEIIRIGGRDESIHITLQDGEAVYAAIETNRDMARRLGSLIFGPTVRLWGTGTWRRLPTGEWRLDRFVVNRFDELGDQTLTSALDTLRTVAKSEWSKLEDPIGTHIVDRRADETPELAKKRRR